MKETFNDVFNISISEGGIHCLLNRFAEKPHQFTSLSKNVYVIARSLEPTKQELRLMERNIEYGLGKHLMLHILHIQTPEVKVL